MKKSVEDLTSAELQREINKHQKLDSVLTDKLIEVGRGHETRQDARKKTDSLSLECIRLGDILFGLYSEKDRRMKWHGSLKRIVKK